MSRKFVYQLLLSPGLRFHDIVQCVCLSKDLEAMVTHLICKFLVIKLIIFKLVYCSSPNSHLLLYESRNKTDYLRGKERIKKKEGKHKVTWFSIK